MVTPTTQPDSMTKDEGDRNLEILIADLRPYADRPIGSLRIDMADVRSILALYDGRCPIPTSADNALREAAKDVVDRAFDHYRARNGRMCSIEGDDGEKCWIVPFDAVEDLRQALTSSPAAEAEPVEARKIETVTGDFMRESGEPFWRIEIDGYCADFDHEQAAFNFAAAINRRLYAAPASPTAQKATDEGVLTTALDQNDTMRQELAHIGNLVSDLERAMKADPANDDGTWPDLAGRIDKLKVAALSVQQAAEAMAVNWDELGHTADAVRDAGRVALGAIISFGASHKMAELIVEHVAKFRPATPQPTETQRIVAWLRKDASETRDDVRRLHAARKLTIAQTAEWENLIALKGGIADAIERGAHLAGEKS